MQQTKAGNTLQSGIEQVKQSLANLYPPQEAQAIAYALFEDLLNYTKIHIHTNYKAQLSVSEKKQLNEACEKLRTGMPLQYVTGKVYFADLVLEACPGVLIPRPETEELVSMIIDENKNADNLLDIGTGSGCIPLAVKKQLPEITCLGIDVSEKALKCANINAKNTGLDVHFDKFDILSENEMPETFDIIVSNPPYVRESEKKFMHENVLNYEPELALFVPDDNALLFYDAIAAFAKRHLSEKGKLYFEINEAFSKEVVGMLKRCGYDNIKVKNDLFDKCRFVSAQIKLP